MNVPVEKTNVKTNDKAGEMWYLYVDEKLITAFESWGAPVKEAKEYMKKNNIKGVGTLKKIGRGGSFTITAKDERALATYINRSYNDSASSVDKAIRQCDAFNVWESDEYDDIYVSYESGTYVLYVENKAQADGSKQRMIQLAKQEERMRG